MHLALRHKLFALLTLSAFFASCGGDDKGGETPGPGPEPPDQAKTVAFVVDKWPSAATDIAVSLNFGAPIISDVAGTESPSAFSLKLVPDTSGKNTVYAVSPASSFAEADGSSGVITVDIPSVQSKACGVAVAKSASFYGLPDEISLSFRQLCAFCTLEITGLPEGEKVSSVIISSTLPLTGKWNWNPVSGTFVPTSSGSSETLEVNGGDFTFCCAPQVLGGSEFALVVKTQAGSYSKTFTLPAGTSLEAGKSKMLSFDFAPQENPDPTVWVAKDGNTGYSLVYASSMQSDVSAFAADFTKATGASLMLKALPQRADKEILVGLPEDSSELAVLLEGVPYGFAIGLSGEKLMIAGSDSNWLVLAMEAFAAEFFSKTGDLAIEPDFSMRESVVDPQMIARLLDAGKAFSISATQVLYCAGSGSMTVAQGAASDGKHVFFVMRNTAETQSIVFKYSLDSFEKVGESVVFQGYHCNDMTFDTRHSRALVVHGTGDSKGLTAIDAESLAPTQVNTDIGMGGMTYSPTRNVYGITQGGTKYVLANASFGQTKNFGRKSAEEEGSVNYTAQGMGSDESYVYFPMSGDSDNILVAYDWNGNYKATIHVPVKIEAESLFYAAGHYYLMCDGNSHRAYLYRLIPIAHYGE